MKMTMKRLWLVAALTLCAGATASAYELTVAQSEHGLVGFSVDGTARTSAEPGEVVTITITPDEDYKAEDMTVRAYTTWEAASGHRGAPTLLDDVTAAEQQDGTWTFTMPEANVEVHVTYNASTGINAIYNSPIYDLQFSANGCYDLSGRKIVNGKSQKGLFIIGGKKVIVK